jgi:hypothetical protein
MTSDSKTARERIRRVVFTLTWHNNSPVLAERIDAALDAAVDVALEGSQNATSRCRRLAIEAGIAELERDRDGS